MTAPEVTSRKLINYADSPLSSDAATSGVKRNKGYGLGAGIMGMVHLAVIFPGVVTHRHVV